MYTFPSIYKINPLSTQRERLVKWVRGRDCFVGLSMLLVHDTTCGWGGGTAWPGKCCWWTPGPILVLLLLQPNLIIIPYTCLLYYIPYCIISTPYVLYIYTYVYIAWHEKFFMNEQSSSNITQTGVWCTNSYCMQLGMQ